MLPSVANNNLAVASTGIYFVPSGQSPSIQFLNFADRKISTILKATAIAALWLLALA